MSSVGTCEVLGHLVLVQARSALADFPAADRHASAAAKLGEDRGIPLVGVFTDWYRALRLSVTGDPATAESAYRGAAARLGGTGMSGLDNGILPFALLCHRVRHGLPLEAGDFGAYRPWCDPVVRSRTGAGDTAEVPDSPRDLLFEARTCLHARVAVARRDRPTMERLYTELLPAAGELAGAGSGLLTLGPVAHHLGELATALGRGRAATEHNRQAADLATRAGWAGAAQV